MSAEFSAQFCIAVVIRRSESYCPSPYMVNCTLLQVIYFFALLFKKMKNTQVIHCDDVLPGIVMMAMPFFQ